MTAEDMVDPDARAAAASAHTQFQAEGTYLNTASLGLPPRCSVAALRSALADWEHGRAAYARLVGVDATDVAVGSQVSVFAGLVAAGLPDRSEVLTVPGEFTSIVFPFLAQARRGVTVREVPLEHLAEAVTARTALVAVSAVQSANGQVADLVSLERACAATDTRVLLDTTQAVGWLPIDASRFAYTTGGGYKWLLAPRGTAFFTIQPELVNTLIPHTAGWYAGEDPWTSIYGSPLRLAATARRLDVSPAWHSWVGQAPALELLAGIGVDALYEHALGLANRFREGAGLPPGDSAIVSLDVGPQAGERLTESRIAASHRAGRLRLSFHINNTTDDADLAAEVLSSHIVAQDAV